MKQFMPTTSFKPKKVTQKIISHLHSRASDVIMNRFGLTADGRRKTLEEIGKKYNITRERVRQIEDAAINLIKKSDAYKNEQAVFDELKQIVRNLGSIVAEHELLPHISKDKSTQNHINFFLVLGDAFKKHREDEHFHTRWSIDDTMTEKIHDALRKLYASLKDEDLIPETEMIKKFLEHLKDVAEQYKNEEMAKRWLSMSKTISKNPLGEWGKATSPNIRTRGIKDFAYLVMRRHGSPMHFKEVADSISKIFGKKTHYATCHNELIKDPRFVLVGRGIYALSEWGYKAGIAREVIEDILKRAGEPMGKEEIIKRVMKERYFKKNTILVNLANSKYFKKNAKGLYALA
ncbi:MAG: RNA polymerase sigma factor [Candidatus Nomurabacteria bacterium GW2011_GWF2_43_8]|uniref:RNA polymerase sigma factor n=3 Tax=Candidatus Nomuraibacteriota TaxID=1752729 RepID=A0A0G1FRD7_9BACT|nr:MAG: RNA polymerase sigma factor [Candidatus Nomurabacteria bacterium GW2011_GWA2_43_15]KKT25061.1 MAG: RNA polymerase sigma factor [Candidatus Nomurabacteria bacterium GW2011_GWF2_43_8]